MIHPQPQLSKRKPSPGSASPHPVVESHTIKTLRWTSLALGVFPILWILALYLYAIEASLHLGHWPAYGNPDPKQLGWWIQHNILFLGVLGIPGFALSAAVLAIFAESRSPQFPIWRVMATIFFGVGIFVAFFHIDPGGVFGWFVD